MNHITVRFSERDEYDIFHDAERTTFMATTTRGSYWHEFYPSGAMSRRDRRRQFKEACSRLILDGEPPQMVKL